MTTLHNTAIDWHRINAQPTSPRANRHANRRSNDLIQAVTSINPNTQ
ncbi:hypothetical protein [Actinoplanes flavus]|uniref:Uncharacterized protein n=1 Tax=Actinoplanes flavus TaxID=2820290 RepID=A0ABS3UCU6_9ACTN|nr:hypothetical protein [Actinoplanes flavus]MBO3736596.1 hypothetical protein [Actinoplanes flavus]